MDLHQLTHTPQMLWGLRGPPVNSPAGFQQLLNAPLQNRICTEHQQGCPLELCGELHNHNSCCQGP